MSHHKLSPQEITARIQRFNKLYRMTGLSKKEFSQLIGKSLRVINLWETGKTQISYRNTTSIINGLQRLGIACSEEWLLFGTGDNPFDNGSKDDDANNIPQQQDELFQQFNLDFSLSGLLAFYKKIYPEYLSYLVDDYRFAPRVIPSTLLVAVGVPQKKFKENWIHGYLYTLEKQIIPIDIKRQGDILYGIPFAQAPYTANSFPIDPDELLFPIITLRPVY